jgi:epoxyqueuosine reductase QueG
MAKTLEDEIKSLALKEGAIRAGIANRSAFAKAPPSAEMRYEKRWANTIVSFAVSLGTDWIEDYLGKVTRMTFKKILYKTYDRVYRIGAVIEKKLMSDGFKAHNVIPNGIYRSDHTFEKEIPDHDVKPPLSLRYMAVGAGVGHFVGAVMFSCQAPGLMSIWGEF